jgi:hypothetical protein
MRKMLVAVVAAALMLVLPGAAGADTKKFVVTMKLTPPGAIIIRECGGEPTGATAKLTGTVSPIRAGKKIKIYKRLEGSSTWKLEGTARIRSSGRFTFVDRPTTPNWRDYQARMPDVGSYHRAWSNKVRVYVGYDSCPD